MKKFEKPLLLIIRACDVPIAFFAAIVSPVLYIISRTTHVLPITRRIFDIFKVSVIRRHYYTPLVFPEDLTKSLRAERNLPGIDLNTDKQRALLGRFNFKNELEQLPLEKPSNFEFGYHNIAFESGDAEFYYNIIRHFKPRRIVEIGSGQSTLLALRAIEKNRREGKDTTVTCIEPFEQPWLEELGVTVLRSKVEESSPSIFSSLEENDILFIDSSHVIRPQGDVLFEYLEVLPNLKLGVLVHVHDIFTPRDYLDEWVLNRRRLWNEQYLLEAFLSFNTHFEIIGAVNYLWHNFRDELTPVSPVLAKEPWREPGSFWMRKIG